MTLHRTTLQLFRQLCLQLGVVAALFSGTLAQAQQRELTVVEPKLPSVLKASAPQLSEKTPKEAPADCKPAQGKGECDKRADEAHRLLESIGRDCESCAPTGSRIHPPPPPPTECRKGGVHPVRGAALLPGRDGGCPEEGLCRHLQEALNATAPPGAFPLSPWRAAPAAAAQPSPRPAPRCRRPRRPSRRLPLPGRRAPPDRVRRR